MNAAIREFMGREEIDRVRVAYQGYVPGKDFLIYDKTRKKFLPVANAEHRARLAVADGTIKALTTPALPDRPSLSWLFKVDRHARDDEDDREAREAAARGAMTAAQIMEEQATLPARPTRAPSLGDLDGSAEDSVATPATQWPGEMVRPRYMPTPAPIASVPTPDAAYEAALLDAETEARALRARQELDALAKTAGVSADDFGWVKDRLSSRPRTRSGRSSLRFLARAAGTSHEKFRRRVAAAIDAMCEAGGINQDVLAMLFRVGYGDGS